MFQLKKLLASLVFSGIIVTPAFADFCSGVSADQMPKCNCGVTYMSSINALWKMPTYSPAAESAIKSYVEQTALPNSVTAIKYRKVVNSIDFPNARNCANIMNNGNPPDNIKSLMCEGDYTVAPETTYAVTPALDNLKNIIPGMVTSGDSNLAYARTCCKLLNNNVDCGL